MFKPTWYSHFLKELFFTTDWLEPLMHWLFVFYFQLWSSHRMCDGCEAGDQCRCLSSKTLLHHSTSPSPWKSVFHSAKMTNRKEPPFFNDDSAGAFQYKFPFYDTMELFIETLTGTCFELRVLPFEAVVSVKAKIQRLEGTNSPVPFHYFICCLHVIFEWGGILNVSY